MKMGDPMKDEYDFSTAERGKFFRKGAGLVPPVHLEPDVLAYLSELAVTQGTSLNDLVNTLLKEDIERIDAAK
jgi:predicted HicB family RNase H-like nuclease